LRYEFLQIGAGVVRRIREANGIEAFRERAVADRNPLGGA
jgi:hypothetical protein